MKAFNKFTCYNSERGTRKKKNTHSIVDGPTRSTELEVKNAMQAEGHTSTHAAIAWSLILPAEWEQRSSN